jgi:hypothetical protein
MLAALRSLGALSSCAVDTLYVACVWLVHDVVVPRGELYRLKYQETQSGLNSDRSCISVITLKSLLRFCAIHLKRGAFDGAP